jgi:HEAT repeat protein
MLKRLPNLILTRHWLRVALAVIVIVAGLAPVGVPILSDNTWRQVPLQPQGTAVEPTPFTYRWSHTAGETNVLRSDDGGRSWHAVATIPQPVAELVAVRGDEQTVLARGDTDIWISRDGGLGWTRGAGLPSRPLAMALGSNGTDPLLVGTESVGLLLSRDLDATWQPVEDAALSAGNAAPLAVTALAQSDGEDATLYGATAIWLGTNDTRLTPIGVYASLDGGRRWLEVSRLPLGTAPITELRVEESHPLAVSAEDETGTIRSLELRLTPELLALLAGQDAALRASAAEAIGRIGDTSALPALLSRLDDSDALAGDAAATAIGRLGDRSAVPALTQALNADDEETRARAARALGALGAAEVAPQLSRMLLSDGPMAARGAAEALAKIGTEDAIAALATPLSAAEMTAARHAAMMGLELAGTKAVPALAAALGDHRPALRTNAAEMLGWLKAAPATAALAQALADPEPAVRQEAAWALGEIATPEAKAALSDIVAAQTDTATQQAATSALNRAEMLTGERSAHQNSWDLLARGLTAIPASRWTMLAFSLGLAALLLAIDRRQPRLRV